MKTIIWNLETSMQGADWSGEFDVTDGTTEEEINEMVREEVFNIVSWGWSVKDPQSPQETADG